MKCQRVVERVDEEFNQCVRCNALDIREAGLLILIDALGPEDGKRYIAELRDLR